jgi:MoaA/NifB/PqqE/SkfB family radical SAM enzyme
MCDIWKGNKNLKQLTEADVSGLLSSLKKFGTRQVVMSGGEALLNQNFFGLCELLKKENIKVTLLSTGLTLKKHANELLLFVNDIIVSLDGDEALHDSIRNIPGAFRMLKEGVGYIKSLNPSYRITGRTVIHKLNFKSWSNIIQTAKDIGLDQISFLPADVSSQAFNREVAWDEERQNDVLINENELAELKSVIDELITTYQRDFENGFIAESTSKIRNILTYYSALQGLNHFPYKKCNAPWVSTVIEADGSVKPCFFHGSIGNIRENSLSDILNSKKAIDFRRNLDMETNDPCRKCVCYLNLPPHQSLKST